MKSLQSTCALALVISISGCVAQPTQTDGTNSGDLEEDVASTEQPLITYAHAQAFGAVHGTPGVEEFGRFGIASAAGDLNGDGAEDLVVGIMFTDGASPTSEGGIAILWGQKTAGASFGGLANDGLTFLYKPAGGEPGEVDGFGSSIAIGDFNCDGHPDIAVGAPYDQPINLPSAPSAGNVTVFDGPSFASSHLFWQGIGSPSVRENGDYFGATLAAGNFNGDSFAGHACDDLAIGAPGETLGSSGYGHGAVTILYGRSTGLNGTGATPAQFFHQDTGSIQGVANPKDNFGSALAAGDFNSDGKDDLAVGAKGEGYEGLSLEEVGIVHEIKGSAIGLTAVGNELLELSDFSSLGLQPWAWMGSALAAGDFDGDGDDDLAVGVPGLTVGGHGAAGGVLIYRQISGGLFAKLAYDQDHPKVPPTAQYLASCGASLAAGDFNGDGQDDLASGCPGDGVTNATYAEGAVNVAYFGFVSGYFDVVSGQYWHQDILGIPDACGIQDMLGTSLAAGDFNGDGKADLAAGAPYDSNGTLQYKGVENVFYGAP